MQKKLAAIALTLAIALTACGGGGSNRLVTLEPPPAGIAIARTTDAQGEPHVLSLELPAPALQAAMGQNSHFVVITRSTGVANNLVTPLFVVNGDVAIADWRFGLDFAAPDEAAPILVFKAAGGTVRTLVAQLSAWAEPGVFNADPKATQARLLKIVETAIANAADPALAPFYGDVAKALTDPGWNGVLVLNPSLPSLPAVVQGRVPQAQRLAAHHLRIELPPLATDPAGHSISGLIDYPRAPVLAAAGQGDNIPALLVELRALFVNSGLALYEAQVKHR